MKKALKKLILLIFLLLVIGSPILYFNIVIDPFGIFDSENILKLPNFICRKLDFIIKNPKKFDSFILGSSRVNYINPEMFPEKNYYNMWTSGGTNNDMLAQLKTLLQYNIKVKNIILGLDEHNYLADPNRHNTNLQFLHYPNSIIDKFLFYKKLILSIPDKKIIKNALSVSFEINDYGVCPDTTKNAENRININNSIFKKPYAFNFYRINIDDALLKINEIKNICIENNINLNVFINPRHYVSYLNFDLSLYQKFLKGLSKFVSFYDFSGINSVTINNLNYIETSHYNNHTGRMIIGRIFNMDSIEVPNDFGIFVNNKNIDNHIKSQLKKVYNFSDKKLLLEDYKKINNPTKCKIVSINGKRINKNKEVYVFGKKIHIRGWAFDCNKNSFASDVYLKIGDEIFDTDYNQKVNAVAKYFNNQELEFTGFSAKLPEDKIKYGKFPVSIITINSDKSYYLNKGIFELIIQRQDFCLTNRLPGGTHYGGVTINKKPVLRSKSPIKVRGLNITIDGWAIDKNNKHMAKEVYVEFDGMSYKTQYGLDSKYLKKPLNSNNYNQAAFRLTLPGNIISDGLHVINLKIVTNYDSKYYDIKKPIFIDFIKSDLPNLSKKIAINNTTHYELESINNCKFENNDDLIYLTEDTLHIEGWALDKINTKVAGGVIFEIAEKQYYTACWKQKTKVLERFIYPGYEYCGFDIKIPTGELPKGRNNLKMRVLTNDMREIYDTDENITIYKVLPTVKLPSG